MKEKSSYKKATYILIYDYKMKKKKKKRVNGYLYDIF